MDLNNLLIYLKRDTVKVDHILQKENNNFNLLRQLAAIGVIFGHSFYLFHSSYEEPIKSVLHFTYSGTLCVYIFFFVSGMLVTQSFFNTSNNIKFIIKRFARIWPGLAVCLFLTVFVIGPFFTTIGIKQYFLHGETRDYLITNALLVNTRFYLPGVFEKNLFRGGVNGSLWTLPAEVRCYTFVLLLGLIGILRNRIYVLCISLIILALYIFHVAYLNFFFSEIEKTTLFIFFLAGILVYCFKDKVIINNFIGVGLFILFLFIRNDGIGAEVLFDIFLIYATLCFSKDKFLRRIKFDFDYSYGIYIYGFLVQQIIAYKFGNLSSYQSMCLTIPITVIVAMLSWHFIEKPSLNFAKRIMSNYQIKSLIINKL
jgi:peptidoglycan/LPS O-acetylase OafA/YrhL